MASEDPDMMAAELALGLLDGAERAEALRRALADPAFAREVEEWRDRLASLFDDYPEVPAPERVAARLAEESSETTAPRRRWPLVALITAVAAMLAFLLVPRIAHTPTTPAPHAVVVASLTTTDKSASLPAVIDLSTGEARVAAAALAPSGKSAELWMIGSDGVPKSMGVLADAGPSRMILPAKELALVTAGVKLAVSIEPVGGSPTGKPTGPIVASGTLLAT
jgi:anti-sigma-K factor RskA